MDRRAFMQTSIFTAAAMVTTSAARTSQRRDPADVRYV